ncbi:MAG: hypothetical protein ACJ73L_11595 [Actinomycetes bacterium]
MICAYIVLTVLAAFAVLATLPGIAAPRAVVGVMLAKDAALAGLLLWRRRVTARELA